jgi:sugar lactone lactonase YvrE
MRHSGTTIATVLLNVALLAQTSAAATILAAPVTPPGSAPSYNGPVHLYSLDGTGPLVHLSDIAPRPATFLSDPDGVAFSSTGELFVSNRHSEVGNTFGSIARFLIDPAGNWTPNDRIVGNGLENVTGLAFSPDGELFASNFSNGKISRFTFDATGAAVPNGVIDIGLPALIGLAFSPNGELFASNIHEIRRFTFDSSHQAVASGVINVPGASQLHYLEFSPDGELFVPDVITGYVHRFKFDSLGNASPNGNLYLPHNPIGLAFSPDGELFVSFHHTGGIRRFLFDGSGNPIPNGFLPSDTLGDIAIRADFVQSVPEPTGIAMWTVILVCVGASRRLKKMRSRDCEATA